MARLTLNLLGHPEVRLDGDDLGEELLPYQKAFALLVYLVVTGRPQSRAHLAELLWPDLDESTGLAYLRGRSGLTRLRATLDDFLHIDRLTVAIDRDSDLSVDVERFRGLLHEDATLDQLETAVALYRDDFCAGFLPPGVSAEFEMWLLGQREQLRQRQMSALEQLVAGCARWREYERARAHARRLLDLDPWLESSHRWVMRLHAWQGQTERALAHYEICRNVLEEEVGVEPAAETVRLRQQIEEGSLAPPPAVPFLAPALPAHFVRPETVLDEVIERLRPGARLALVGMGGVGKSTLAAAAAHATRLRFPDGVLWANPTHSPAEDTLLTWAGFYDFDLSALNTFEAMALAWRGIAGDRRLLVVLDGVTAAEQIRPLLPHSDRCAVLLTTRHRDVATALDAGLFELEPLGAPAGQQMVQAILGERALEEADSVAAICQLLEGLPLALEILARRLRSRPQLSVEEIEYHLRRIRSRLDMLHLEDRAVRSSFELSWQMLEAPLQSTFASLAVFEGRPFHPDAVAAIAGEEAASWHLADLAALSLVQTARDDYYRQHALLADYAREKADELALDEAALEGQMAGYYAGFVARHHEDVGRLRQEWGNVQAALHAAHRHRDWQRVYDLGRQMTQAWFVRARFSQARDAYRLSYDAGRMLEDDEGIAQTLLDWGRACIEQGDYDEAEQHLDESLRLFREYAGDPIRAADVQLARGRLATERSRFDDAERRLDQAHGAFTPEGDRRRLALVNFRRAQLAYLRSELDEAQQFCEAAVDDLDGEDFLVALNWLADIYMKQDDLDAAESCLLQSRQLCEELKDKANMAVVEAQFGRLHLRREDLELARTHRERSLQQFRQMGDRKSEAYALYDLSLIAEQEADYAAAIALAGEGLDIFTQVDDTFNVMNTMVLLGDLHRARDQDDQAKTAWSRALALAESLDNARYAAGLHQRLEQLK